MKVLHAVTSLDPAAGGPPLIAASLAAAQAGHGHDVSLLYASDGGEADPLAWIRAQVPGFGAVQLLKATPAAAWKRLTGVTPTIQAAVADAEVVHLHSVWDPILVEAGRAARRRGTPYLVLLNGMLDPWSLSQSRWKKRLSLRLFHRRHLDAAAALHVGNEDERRLIERLGLKAPTIKLANGIFLDAVDRPAPDGGLAARVDGLDAGEAYVLFLSRLHFKKGLDLLAEAFAEVAPKHPSVKLVVAGPDGGAEQPFREAIAAAGLTDRIVLTGPLQGDDKHAAFSGATCFCLPSRQEGFSMACIEALAYGRPAVITEGCHFPEVAEVGAGRVVPVAAGPVARALNEVLTDADLRERMGQAGATYTREHLTWEALAEKAIEIYEGLKRDA